ncbi:hypothetical protein BIV57_19805 [Mangrovactinospora gilvigrisea]|uniref:Uncharacterized protein n=1 Tax=Mangrovactinospora gilvigrisea TaxID=1428644 RepID=A0A1J7BAY2_9ACTN|nr:hypothetical protein [Mangrovactinospora gilvigrisea]OIV35774.1 hypothetical protein BIV57_19805 [Mangrovactinospora gilvigrisea]
MSAFASVLAAVGGILAALLITVAIATTRSAAGPAAVTADGSAADDATGTVDVAELILVVRRNARGMRLTHRIATRRRGTQGLAGLKGSAKASSASAGSGAAARSAGGSGSGSDGSSGEDADAAVGAVLYELAA